MRLSRVDIARMRFLVIFAIHPCLAGTRGLFFSKQICSLIGRSCAKENNLRARCDLMRRFETPSEFRVCYLCKKKTGKVIKVVIITDAKMDRHTRTKLDLMKNRIIYMRIKFSFLCMQFCEDCVELKSKRSSIISRCSGSKFDQSRAYIPSAFASLFYLRLCHFICTCVFRSMWHLELALVEFLCQSSRYIFPSLRNISTYACMHGWKFIRYARSHQCYQNEMYRRVYVCVFPWTSQRHQGSIDLSWNWLANDGHKLNPAESLIDDVNKIGSSVSHIGRLHIRSLSFRNKIHPWCIKCSLNNEKFKRRLYTIYFVSNNYV